MIDSKKIQYLTNNKIISKATMVPFSNQVCTFFDELSKNLLKNKEAKKYTDIIAFAFWCRKKNLEKFKRKIELSEIRLGLGLIFHICPSNVPMNFAYSFGFGFLTGNNNIIRVPSKKFAQIRIVCDEIEKILRKKKFSNLKRSNLFIRYDHQEEFNSFFSSKCNARMIWGSDETINKIRNSLLPVKSFDITFSDRYSFSLFNSNKIANLNKKKLSELAKKFYNDTYILDQNGCSSPHLICWLGNKKKIAKNFFWAALNEVVKQKYDLPNIGALDKFTKLSEDLIENKNIKEITRYDNGIYILSLKKLDKKNHEKRGLWGYFYQYDLKKIDELTKIINRKYQSLTYFGFSLKFFKNFILKNNLDGLDRIVPTGQSLEMDFTWDGYDMIKKLTRVVEIK